jgi:hypothetical protein
MLVLALPCAAAAQSVARVEAESAALAGGAGPASDHGGYSGSGFVGGYTDGNRGRAQWSLSVNAAVSGVHTLAVRYSNGTGATKTLTVWADGVAVPQIAFAPTSSWEAWAVQGFRLPLGAVDTVRLVPHHVAHRPRRRDGARRGAVVFSHSGQQRQGKDSTYQGLLLSFQRNISNLVLDGLTIDGASTYGIEVIANGSATVSNTSVKGAAKAGLALSPSYTLIRGPGNSGF